MATELTEKLILCATENSSHEEMVEWAKDFQKRLQWLEGDNAARVNIEQLFHYARFDAEIWRMQQHMCPVGRNHGETPYAKSEQIEAWLSYLEKDLVEVLWAHQQKATMEPINRFTSCLTPDDVVMSFNYDTLVETALSKQGKRWQHGLAQVSDDHITVLKLHGSLDWVVVDRKEQAPENSTRLFTKADNNAKRGDEPANDEREYHDELWRVDPDRLTFVITNRMLNNRRFGVAGLGSFKELHLLPGSGLIWARADRALRSASEVYIVGFSLSPFDGLAELYFGTAMQERIAKGDMPAKVMLIDPKANEHLQRFKRVFGDAVKPIDQHSEDVDWDRLLCIPDRK